MSKLIFGLFTDMGEQDHVFDMLDEWAASDVSYQLREIFDVDAYPRKQIKAMADWVAQTEEKNGVPRGASNDSQILGELDDLLSRTVLPSDLRQNIAEIKSLMQKVQFMGLEMKVSRMRPFADHGVTFTTRQAEKSRKGADARWGKRKGINEILKSLADETDALQDLLPLKELWGPFYSRLDNAGLSPDDNSRAEYPKDNDRMSWSGNPDGMTFKAFKNKISAIRNPKK